MTSHFYLSETLDDTNLPNSLKKLNIVKIILKTFIDTSFHAFKLRINHFILMVNFLLRKRSTLVVIKYSHSVHKYCMMLKFNRNINSSMTNKQFKPKL